MSLKYNKIIPEKIAPSDSIVLYKMKANKGDVKLFRRDEISGRVAFPRSLQPNDPYIYPLKCIPVYLKGSFEFWSDGAHQYTRRAGDVPDRTRTEDWNSYNKAAEDDSLYFCIYKLDDGDKYIHRKVIAKDWTGWSQPQTHDRQVIVCDHENPYVIDIPKNTTIDAPSIQGNPMMVLIYTTEE